jgi:hypothetical protein
VGKIYSLHGNLFIPKFNFFSCLIIKRIVDAIHPTPPQHISLKQHHKIQLNEIAMFYSISTKVMQCGVSSVHEVIEGHYLGVVPPQVAVCVQDSFVALQVDGHRKSWCDALGVLSVHGVT